MLVTVLGFAQVEQWTWVSGSNAPNQPSVYGTKGIASATTVPGGRYKAISWINASGDLYLFGGEQWDGSTGLLNDLWKYDGTNWTWVSGSNTMDQLSTYGTQGVTTGTNMPGARRNSISWIGTSGDLWLFGGSYDDTGSNVRLNDLWKFDGTDWTWMSGNGIINQFGIYGTRGTADANNAPGSRDGANSWTDSSGNLWLFGGYGYADISPGNNTILNDLWKYDGVNWTWVSGGRSGFEGGNYGTLGTASANNVPGARESAVSWIDEFDNLWLFGGWGRGSGDWGYLNDLWKFDGTNWTWMSGSNAVDQPGNYGTKGTAAANNMPGARENAISWIDNFGNLWMYGGFYNYEGDYGYLNDLWIYDGVNWVWMSGSNQVGQFSVYGTQNNTAPTNMPGGRQGGISWTDASGNLWHFGGYGYADDGGGEGRLNDLWRYNTPDLETDILSFSVPDQKSVAVPDFVNHRIDVEVPYGTDLSSLIPTFTLSSTAASATVNDNTQVSGVTANDFTDPITYTIHAFTRGSEDWIITVENEKDTESPIITNTILPSLIESRGPILTASIEVTDNFDLAEVYFNSRLLNGTNFNSQLLTSSNSTYLTSIVETQITDVGFEYYFLAIDASGNADSTETVQIVINYSLVNGPTIPNLSAGGKAENWRMFSIPFILENKTLASLFEVPLGIYDQSKWRIFHYKNDTEQFLEYRDGLSGVVRGKGYWFNSVQPAIIPMSPGKGPSNTTNNLATLTLQQGWNQIGNPYTFDITWSDVVYHNGIVDEVENNLRIFVNGTSLTNSNLLRAFGGAYLWANQVAILEVPMKVNTGGRFGAINEFEDGWLLQLNLQAGIFSNTVSGLGMHPDASVNYDRIDQIRSPRFSTFIDITFDHPEYIASYFSRDAVPNQENYAWEFTLTTNIENELREIRWNNLELQMGQNLLLVDQSNGNVIDMSVSNNYSYYSDNIRKFKVLYGNDEYVVSQFDNNNFFLGDNYPNPFDNATTVPFSVYGKEESYKVQINVYSISGALVKTLVNETFQAGIYSVQWDGTDNGANELNGMYIYSLEIETKSGTKSIRKKIIVQ